VIHILKIKKQVKDFLKREKIRQEEGFNLISKTPKKRKGTVYLLHEPI
jgi:hypothetical protein